MLYTYNTDVRKRKGTNFGAATNKTSTVQQAGQTRRSGGYLFLSLLIIVVWNQNVMKPKSNTKINDQQTLKKKSAETKSSTSIESSRMNLQPAQPIERPSAPPVESPSQLSGTFQSVSRESVKGLPVLTVLNRKRICYPPKRNSHYVLRSRCGSESMGNGLSDLFIMAVEILQLNSTFEIQCDRKDGIQEKYWTNAIWRQQDLAERGSIPNMCEVCWSWPHTCKQGLNYGIPMMQSLFARIPTPTKGLDEVVIHIRCGDILKHKRLSEYGYPRYETYKEWLAPHANIQSIGILTANFEDPSKAREKDLPFLATCKAIVEDLASYLQSTFESSTVTIRNSDLVETTAARMVYAKHAWCNPSTFCLYPTLATTGQAYLVKSQLYPFVETFPTQPTFTSLIDPFSTCIIL